MVLPSPWQKFVWPELHHLKRHQPERAEIGLMKQLGAMKRFHSEKENVDEHLLSDSRAWRFKSAAPYSGRTRDDRGSGANVANPHRYLNSGRATLRSS